MCGYFIECIDIVFNEYQLFYIIAITLKVPLFFLMRCAESQPDLFSIILNLFLLVYSVNRFQKEISI
jgi:hypothetical protein